MPSLRSYTGKDKDYRNEVKQKHNNRFEDHFTICKLGLLCGFEIIINSISEGEGEIRQC